MKYFVFGLLFLLGSALSEEIDESLVTEVALEAQEVIEMESTNYPEDAPAHLVQTWKLKAPEGHVVKLDCEDIRLFEENPCGDYVFTLTDSSGTTEICRVDFDYHYVSEGETLEAIFKTGEWDRGFLKCTAKALTPEDAQAEMEAHDEGRTETEEEDDVPVEELEN